jgi:hypothetical protein
MTQVFRSAFVCGGWKLECSLSNENDSHALALHGAKILARGEDHADMRTAIDRLKEIIIAPRDQLIPLLRFRGNQKINRIQSYWSFAHAMMLNGAESLADGTALSRETELPHFCGIHTKYPLPMMTLHSFFSRLAYTPEVTDLSPHFTDFVHTVCPHPFQLGIVGVGVKHPQMTPARRAWRDRRNVEIIRERANKHVLEQLKTKGPTDYLLDSKNHNLMTEVHKAIPTYVAHAIRSDLCQDILCAIIAGDISIDNVPDEVGRYMRQAHKLIPHTAEEYNKFGTSGNYADAWKEQYVPFDCDDRSIEEKMRSLQEHLNSGDWKDARAPDFETYPNYYFAETAHSPSDEQCYHKTPDEE